MKIDLVNDGLVFVNAIPSLFTKEAFVIFNPTLGAILLALLHFILLVQRQSVIWNSYRSKINYR